MCAAQAELGKRVNARGMRTGRGDASAPTDLAQFRASLKVAWSEEEQPAHKRRHVRVKPVVQMHTACRCGKALLAALTAALIA